MGRLAFALIFALVSLTGLAHRLREAAVALAGRRAVGLRERDDRGVEVLEWVGVLILTAGIIAGLYSIGIPERVAGTVDDWVDKILNSPGGEQP